MAAVARLVAARRAPGGPVHEPALGTGDAGIRPEKVLVARHGRPIDPSGNQVQIGVIVDTSFLGVSKRYVVRMPWGQEITAFEQNTGIRGGMAPGTQVDVRWRPEIAFLLDASQDIHAGAQEE